MMKNTLILMLCLLPAMVGCSTPEEPEARAEPQAPQQHLFSTQQQVLEQAKAVEQVLQQAGDARRRQILEQTN